jgi:hypothetical protein
MKTKTRIVKNFKNHPILFCVRCLLFLLILQEFAVGITWVWQLTLIQPVYAAVEYKNKGLIEQSKETFNKKQHRSHRYLSQAERNWVLDEVLKAGLNQKEALCLIDNESSWDAEGTLINKDGKSVDRGLWAINSYWHYEVSNDCAYDVECSTKESIRIRKADGNWNQWTGFVNNCQ